MALDETVKARLMAYCRIDALEEGEDTLLEGLYQAAVNYMADAGIGEPQQGTPRRDHNVQSENQLLRAGDDRRGATVSGSALEDNPVFRRMIVQLKLTEPVSESDT